MKLLAPTTGRRRFARVIAAAVAIAAMVAINGSATRDAVPAAIGQGGVLIRFVAAGPGPTQTVLDVAVSGAATETSALIRSTHRSRFRLARLALEALESRILAADFPRLRARYGMPNPGGVFTETTSAAKTATVYAPSSGPPGLHRLNLDLEQIVTTH